MVLLERWLTLWASKKKKKVWCVVHFTTFWLFFLPFHLPLLPPLLCLLASFSLTPPSLHLYSIPSGRLVFPFFSVSYTTR